MSITTVNYFHSASLRQRFIDQLADALQSGRLRVEEQLWLEDVARPLVSGGPDPVRVDRLIFNDGSIKPFELSAALLFSHARPNDSKVYLYTLANGIEVLDNRIVLLDALRTRFARGNVERVFECEKIEGDPFRAQMLAIVDHQVQYIEQLTLQLKRLPSLLDASIDSLRRQLRRTVPHLSIDPETHLLQLVAEENADTEKVPFTQTLAQATFDDSCKVRLAQGVTRQFLDARGVVVNAADAALCAQALTDAAAGVGEQYMVLLRAFWRRTWSDQRTCRDLAVESLNNSFRHELYGLLHDDTLTTTMLKTLLPLVQSETGILSASNVLCSRLTLSAGGASCPLGGTFLIRSRVGADRQVVWFSPDHRLIRFADRAALSAYFSSAQGRLQLRPALALPDQSILSAQGQLQVELDEIEAPVFADRVDSIIALQARNLAYAMALPSAPEQVTAMLDDALDIRQLLDPRQLQFNAGRWCRDLPLNFAEVWIEQSDDLIIAQSPGLTGNSTAISQTELDVDPHKGLAASWVEQSQDLDLRAQHLRQMDSVLIDFAEQALQRYICVLVKGPACADDIRVQWLESAPVDPSDVESHAAPVSESLQRASMKLVSFLLECVSGHRSRFLPSGAHAVLGTSQVPARLKTDLINHMLETMVTTFIDRYLQRFEQSRFELRRQGNQQWRPATATLRLREDAMRLDLALGIREKRIDPVGVNVLRQALDRPVRALRSALGRDVTEAFSIWLTCGDHPPILLCDTMVLNRPLLPGSPVILWTPMQGWQQTASIEALKHLLQRKLHGRYHERWLALLGERDRTVLCDYLLSASANQLQIELRRIDGHIVQALQQGVHARERQDLRQLCLRAVRCRFEAGLFRHSARMTESDEHLTRMLDGLSVRIAHSIFNAMLPSWMTAISNSDLSIYYNILRRNYLASEGGKDFLFDIPALRDYAFDQLASELLKDFPEELLNPDQITVVSRRYVSAVPAAGELPFIMPAATVEHQETLTEYSINRFVEEPDAALTISSVEQPHAERLLTPYYIRRLTRRLDIGAGYRVLLRKAFTPDEPQFTQRRRLFIDLLPSLLQGTAFPEKLQGRLSAQAYAFLSRVLEMPDGIAREPVAGVRVIISPLQLVADPGMAPDTVAGLYVIGPAWPGAGPVLLYAIYADFIFREYPSQAALIADIRQDRALQKLVLERLDPAVHRRYANGGFTEPHLASSVGLFDFDVPLRRPGPVALGITEINGNALQELFNGTVDLLLNASISNTVTNAQVDHAGRAFLAALGLGQALTLLPSKLGALVTLWQSHSLFHASAVSASGHRWGKALSEFTAAVGAVVAAREQAVEEPPSIDPIGTDSSPAEPNEDEPSSPYSWTVARLDPEQQIRLQRLEAQGVALNEMRHDKLLNLFMSKKDATPYAVVNGKVYRVRGLPEEGTWSIVGADGSLGPQIKLDSNQRWQLVLDQGLKGGGGVVTKLRASDAQRGAEEGLIIEAMGMPEIRAMYRDRARRIGRAHFQARSYLQNCLDNLNLRQGNSLDPRVSRLVGDFFGVASPDENLLNEMKSSVKTMLEAFTDDSLSPFSSPRFIVGTNRPGRESVIAFVMKKDPKRRVFLTDRFFNVPAFAVRPEAVREGFEVAMHYQAANLLHELSHLALDTHDIAYVEAMAPYPDLLREDNPTNVRMRTYIEDIQQNRLSHHSPADILFTRLETGKLRDITADDDRGLATVLRIAKTTRLERARELFLTDARVRSKIMLKNADTLTLLILRLGRRNYVVSGP
ncbi:MULTISPECIES: dermonecrotic toxin domain-containing protein [unclassified Pseudomonas]|uniref:dermonecrotic toxin domain-containing protein n=1 Tax=unclassified Pseudomonas TaxID=196821 RepID=UPI0025EC9F69|nr:MULTISPECIES: DUF6543 domain-containing protein [unclassified Pseudomonas]